jgi:hypothetical protein
MKLAFALMAAINAGFTKTEARRASWRPRSDSRFSLADSESGTAAIRPAWATNQQRWSRQGFPRPRGLRSRVCRSRPRRRVARAGERGLPAGSSEELRPQPGCPSIGCAPRATVAVFRPWRRAP